MVVDVQNDFCPGGSLAVEGGDKVVPGLNKVIDAFQSAQLPIFFTRDWHPRDHISFKARGGVWPSHCVQGTRGAEFHPDLHVPPGATVISKGDRPDAEAYSGFQGTDLGSRLKGLDVEEIVLGGLTTDYCVRESTMDARRLGLEVYILKDCVRGVNLHPGDTERAIADMAASGAKFTTSPEAIRMTTDA